MQTDEKIRQKLLEAYESLPPPEQALVQLCSVIYEPVSVGALYKIFRKSGLSFPGEKIGSIRALEPHLQSLKELRLLNDTLQVPREVIEIVTRRAVAAGRIFTAGSLLEGIESREAWTDNPRGSHCISCGKAARDHAFMPAPGPLCPACATSEIQIAAAEENLHDWSVERILTALSPEGDLKSRLTVIWKCNEAERTVIRDMDKFLTLLVQNLGYVDPHPLAPTVREAALHACTRRGPRILPLLFKVIQKEPWQFYANVLGAMVLIASEKPEVHTLVKEAANDPNPEVRRHIIFLLSHYPPSWGFRVIEQLSRDEDSAIRKMAKDALTVLKSKQRRPFSAPFAAFGSSNLTSKYSMRFGPLVRAVHEELPLAHGYSSSYSVAAAPRILRDFRIGIYSQDMHLFRACLQDLYSLHSRLPDIDVSMAQICNDPFDTAWFAGLPTNVRMALLSAIFRQAVIHLEPDAEALAFTLKDPLFKSAPRFERAALLYDLVSRLILGGRLDDARRIIPEIDGRDYTGGLMGWVHFVEGKINDAIGSFEADLKEFRRRCGKRNINFTGTGGLFYVLALLKSGNIDLVKRAEQLVGWSLASMDDSDFKTSPYRSLKGIICAQNLKMEEAKRILETESKAGGVIPTLFNAIAAYWVNGRLSREMIERLEPIFQTAGQVGMDWVSMECAALLIRNNRATSMHREFLDRVIKQSGMRPLVSSIEAEEPWQKGLRAILEIAGASEEPVVQKSTSATRLIWLVGYYSGRVSLQPLEQRTMPKGGWTKGRPVAMSRLFNRTKLENLGPQDNAICAAIKHERSYYHGDTYTFDMDKLLPSLVGHPLLFMEQSPSVPVEFVKGEPEILVTQSGSMLNIRFAIEFGEDRVEVIQETPTRFKVIEFTDQHRRFAQVLGSGGLFVPASGKQDVLKAISALSSHALVHSEIGGRSKDVVEVASDPTPHVHLVPSGHGFRLEVFVKPFKEERSPYLKPGVGATNVIAEVGGKRVQTQRDLKAEERMADALDAASPTISRLADSDRQCQLEDPEDCLQLLLDLKALQEEGQVIVEWPEGEKLKVTREVPIDRFRMKIRGRTEWFEVSGSLQVDDDLVIDMKRLLELVNTTSTRFIPLEEGQFLALTREFRKRLEELNAYAERKGKEVRLHPLAALAVQDLIKGIPNLEVDEAWKSRLERIRAGQEISPPVPSTFKAELRDYQLEGYWWMTRLAHMGIGACLADDMGLGKTIQVLAVMLQRASQGPALVVAPTSVCWNWLAEAHRFAPTLNMVQLNAMNREELVKGLKRHDVLVTSYGLLAQEAELLAGIEWSLIVLDEAQAIKNVLTQRSQAAMGLKGGFKIITTGTPIENHLGELWTLFNFINPGLLGSLQRFNERFAVPIEKYNNRDARKRLKKLIQPFILRRLKSQVLEELPPRTEVVLQVEMSPEETAFYEALRQQALARIEADSAPLAQKHLRILAEIMKLRQAACHPRLVLPETPLSSSKLELFDEVVSELLENRHKALVFSQFVGHLSLIREYLDQRNIGYRYLDGSTPPKERKKAVDAFQAGEGDLFLISLKAGGLGLNLTAADYVIHMDPWWNPAVEDQASDRAHRIGQQHPVTVYRLVTAGTIEEKIVKLHQEKRDLAGSLLDGSDISGKISAEELVRLIREA